MDRVQVQALVDETEKKLADLADRRKVEAAKYRNYARGKQVEAQGKQEALEGFKGQEEGVKELPGLSDQERAEELRKVQEEREKATKEADEYAAEVEAELQTMADLGVNKLILEEKRLSGKLALYRKVLARLGDGPGNGKAKETPTEAAVEVVAKE